MKNCRLVSLPSLKEAAWRNPQPDLPLKREKFRPSAFLVSWGQGKLFCIRTYGCQANVRDSEMLRHRLLLLGMKETDDFEKADFVLFNTCAIRENAENHLYGELGRVKGIALKKPDLFVAVCGCVMQEEKPVRYILDHFGFISLVFGTNNIDAFYDLLEESLKAKGLYVDVRSAPEAIVETEGDDTAGRQSRITAFVDIAYGCDKFCTYCIVPYTRGKERSRKKEDIVREVLMLKEKGYRQVTLLGQNVDSYGKDFGDNYAFADLLDAVAGTGIDRIRFTTPYPSDFNEKVFDVMAKHPNVMPSLHLPVQSGSDIVLKRMNRRYTRKQYLDIVHALRERLPDVYLTTDIIVGFPGETEEDFLDTLSLCEECRYDGAFTFIFSPRPGTPASRMKDDTPDEVKHERFERLKTLIDRLSEESAKKMVGTIQEVLFEDVSKRDTGMISGYDKHGKLVHVKGDLSLVGQTRKVRIVESHTYSLIGVIDD